MHVRVLSWETFFLSKHYALCISLYKYLNTTITLIFLNFIPGKNIRHIENDVYTEIEAGSGKYKKGHVVSQITPSAINIEINNEVNF